MSFRRALPAARPARTRGLRFAGLLLVAGTLGAGAARAATIPVEGLCTLPAAINAANADDDAGGLCPPGGSGTDVLVLSRDVTLTAPVDTFAGPRGLPAIVGEILIDGRGFTVARDDDATPFGIFAVAAGAELTLADMTLRNGAAATDDGVSDVAGGEARFHALPPPDDAEIVRVARSTARGIARLLARHGLGPDAAADAIDPFSSDQPLLAALYSAAVGSRVAMGPRTGQRMLRFGDRVDMDHLPPTAVPLCVVIDGLSLHAGVAVPAPRQEPPGASVPLRGPPAAGRGALVPIGGRPPALRAAPPLARRDDPRGLRAVGAAPRFNLIRYHGVLAPAARYRSQVVPRATTPGPS